MTDCGLPYEHDWHSYPVKAGKKVCDGNLTKRGGDGKSIRNEDVQRVRKAEQGAKRKTKKQKAIQRRKDRKWQAND